jgi:hypothetical protein
MKIRTDFITNSSSTQFILITGKDLSQDEFLNLLGILIDSPFAPIFNKLYDILKNEMKPTNGFELENLIRESPRNIAEKLKEATKNKKRIYSGELSTENGDFIESSFCVDSFEAENENFYFNCLTCVW